MTIINCQNSISVQSNDFQLTCTVLRKFSQLPSLTIFNKSHILKSIFDSLCSKMKLNTKYRELFKNFLPYRC